MSITAVPIQPIQKGSIAKFWIVIGILAAIGIGLACYGTGSIRKTYATDVQFLKNNAGEKDVVTTKSGLQYQVLRGGEGPSPTDNDVVLVKYKGTLRSGKVFDENPQGAMPVAGVVPGFSEALKHMQRGGSYRVWIPANLGYGPSDQKNPQTGEVAIPGNSLLIFDVDLLEYKSRAEVDAMQKKMQEMQKHQSKAGPVSGGPDGAPQQLPPEIQAQLDAQAGR